MTYRFLAINGAGSRRCASSRSGGCYSATLVCSLDPIYGQGTSSAAIQAATLGACLERSGAVDRRFARRYFKAASKVVSLPWSVVRVATSVVLGHHRCEPRGTDLLNRLRGARQHGRWPTR